MNCTIVDFLVELFQLLTPIIALVGLFFVWKQIKKQTDQLHSDRLLSLYNDLDTQEAQAGRKFLYNEFSKIAKPTTKQVMIARRVLASFDKMSFQVIRNFADRRAAYDLYGRVLRKVILSTWKWLNQERQQRNDSKGWEYCRYAEQLAKEFAEQNLRELKKLKANYKMLETPKLLELSLKIDTQ